MKTHPIGGHWEPFVSIEGDAGLCWRLSDTATSHIRPSALNVELDVALAVALQLELEVKLAVKFVMLASVSQDLIRWIVLPKLVLFPCDGMPQPTHPFQVPPQ